MVPASCDQPVDVLADHSLYLNRRLQVIQGKNCIDQEVAIIGDHGSGFACARPK